MDGISIQEGCLEPTPYTVVVKFGDTLVTSTAMFAFLTT